jgi:DNA-binding Lrp family transcriptional regulator
MADRSGNASRALVVSLVSDDGPSEVLTRNTVRRIPGNAIANIAPRAALCAIIVEMDPVDRRIIAELQRDGRLSNVELADRIGLTPAPCLRRVKRLESDGVIRGYSARINPAAIGRGFEVLVNVDLTRKDRATFEAFETTVAALDEVIEVRRMFGLPDYLLRVATDSIESYETFVSTRLGDVPGVDKLDSHITMKLIKSPDDGSRIGEWES